MGGMYREYEVVVYREAVSREISFRMDRCTRYILALIEIGHEPVQPRKQTQLHSW